MSEERGEQGKRGGTFRSLRGYNYRTWAIGALVSNVGTWMQRTAQDWLVLTQLTHQSATSVGIVTALQFAPQLVCLPLTGYAADRIPGRRLVFITQTALGLLALGLGLLTVTGAVKLWHVYVFALLLGVATAFDSPARQTFVSELVTDDAELPNAVGLNSTSFNAARMIGPAIAGVLIVAVGSGWVFLLNAGSFVAVLVSLALLRGHELRARKAGRPRGGLLEGFRYVWRRRDLRALLAMILFFGTFGMHYPIFISTMAVKAFHRGAGGFGALTSIMAIGSVTGALLTARRGQAGVEVPMVGAGLFGLGFLFAMLAPGYGWFGAALILIGVSAQTFTTSTIALVQLSTEPEMRGRVMAILLALALGGTPLGAPLVGAVADRFGPRAALGAGALAGLVAMLIGVRYLMKHRGLKLRFESWRPRISLDEERVLELEEELREQPIS